MSFLFRLTFLSLTIAASIPLSTVAHQEVSMAETYNLVNIQTLNPNIRVFMPYATTKNFTGQKVYEKAVCYLRKEVAEKLNKVQKKLEKMGLGLLVWDGYRPLSVQKKFWELVPDENYVANPAKGSRHNRGAAVDLTLVTLDDTELEMPSEFDDFSEKAHRDYMNCSAQALKNRQLLQDVMHEEGFEGWHNEWWHFDAHGWQQYALLDISIEELEKEAK